MGIDAETLPKIFNAFEQVERTRISGLGLGLAISKALVEAHDGKLIAESAYEAAGDNVKVTVDGTDREGKPTHNEWTGKFDGKDYPVTGDPTSDMRSYKEVDDRTLELTVKKDGTVMASGRIVVAADDKSRTITTSGTDPEGKKFENTAVYDKQ